MKYRAGAAILVGMIGILSGSLASAAPSACFSSAKTYRIHPLQGGEDRRDGWAVQGGAFNECVHRAEAADKNLRAHYPDTVYQLSIAATAPAPGQISTRRVCMMMSKSNRKPDFFT